MHLKSRIIHLLLILGLALAPLTSVAAEPVVMDGPVEMHDQHPSDFHHHDHNGVASQADESHSHDDCSGMGSAGDCCATCIGCALPGAVLAKPEPHATPLQLSSQNLPKPDLESERRPPKTNFS